MADIAEVQLEIKAVMFALQSFARFSDDDHQRKDYLRNHFDYVQNLDSYFSFSVEELRGARILLLEKENGLQEQESKLQDARNLLQEKENRLLEQENKLQDARNLLQTKENLLQEKDNLLLVQQQVKTLSMMVKICIGDKVRDSFITFTSLKRPLDTVKEEVFKLELMKRGMSLEPYILVTMKNALVSDFFSLEGHQMLVFHIPEKIIPLSGNEWTDVQLDQLKVLFEDVELDNFFSSVRLSSFQLSSRGAALVDLLSNVDMHLFEKYEPNHNDINYDTIAGDIRDSHMLQNPICKALFAARKYAMHESFVDDFVKHLLNEMGFNDGSLYAAPQMRINLYFGETEKMATADVTVIDLLSFARIGVIEDKNWDEMVKDRNSTAQLVAEGIAITQRNESVGGSKRDAGGDPKGVFEESSSICSETVYGIRVNGSQFHFYAIQVSPQMHSALRNQTAASTSTSMYRYKSKAGLDFMKKNERNEIILMLSLLQEVATITGKNSPRRNSKLSR